MPSAGNDPQAPWGISLGRYLLGPEQFGERQPYSGERNLLVFRPNGFRKSIRFLMPNLLQMNNCSMVVIDPKGELAAVTAPCRRIVGEVVIINPFGVLADAPARAGRDASFFFMDEFAALGHLAVIETTWALVRGYLYGVRSDKEAENCSGEASSRATADGSQKSGHEQGNYEITEMQKL